MSLIICPECRKNISDKAKTCPNCGYSIRKSRKKGLKKILPIICVIIFVIIGCTLGISAYKIKHEKEKRLLEAKRIEEEKAKEAERQTSINNLLEAIDSAYDNADFDAVEKSLDELDSLNYDTSQKRAILDYDREVYPIAYGFYSSITKVNDKINSRSADSLEKLVDSLRRPISELNNASILTSSPLGEYIQDVRKNAMYMMFKYEFIDNDKYDMDYYLTQSGYYIVLSSYTNELASIPFPYNIAP